MRVAVTDLGVCGSDCRSSMERRRIAVLCRLFWLRHFDPFGRWLRKIWEANWPHAFIWQLLMRRNHTANFRTRDSLGENAKRRAALRRRKKTEDFPSYGDVRERQTSLQRTLSSRPNLKKSSLPQSEWLRCS